MAFGRVLPHAAIPAEYFSYLAFPGNLGLPLLVLSFLYGFSVMFAKGTAFILLTSSMLMRLYHADTLPHCSAVN